MMETIQPPTDNLYKFLAIGGLAVVLLALVFLFRDQARVRDRYLEAEIELRALGYLPASSEPKDVEMRRWYFRREAADAEGAQLIKLAGGFIGRGIWIGLVTSGIGFGLWYRCVQRYDDRILRATAAKVEREARAAAGTG
jgi:hypothetical protein